MATTDEIKGMIRDVLEAIKNRLAEIDQQIDRQRQEIAQLEAEKSELQQLLPSWQSAPTEAASTVETYRS